jgi:hypothetical protein
MGRLPRALLVVLSVFLLLPATALAVDADGEFAMAIPLQASDGLSAKLEADDDEIDLTIRKDGQEAVYFAEGEVSPAGIAVRFGRFGEFVVDYEPIRTLKTREPNRHCEGEPRTTTEGYFRGTLRFRGEGNYVHIEAARAKGTQILNPRWNCDYGKARASRALGRKADEDKATLVAWSPRRPRAIRFATFGTIEEGGKPFNAFIVTSEEVREGVGISRFTSAAARNAGFEFDHSRGTALVDPPYPFAGSARYLRRPKAPDRWSGSLSAPLLGLGRVRLVGPSFKALLVPKLPEFE